MIERWIESVCSRAGWPLPFKNSEDKYRFRIEPDLIIDAWSPDERTLILHAPVVKLTRDTRDHAIRMAATSVLPRIFKDSSVLSLDTAAQTLGLHRVVTLGAIRASEFGDVMENFINDLAFYKSL
ncbi:MAG: type III secretion system chaperone [Desulfamplus sp.]|nr:type III secretion system chaperone [Desulfamplus sp.]